MHKRRITDAELSLDALAFGYTNPRRDVQEHNSIAIEQAGHSSSILVHGDLVPTTRSRVRTCRCVRIISFCKPCVVIEGFGRKLEVHITSNPVD